MCAARLAVAQTVIVNTQLRQSELQAVLAPIAYSYAPSPFDSLVSMRRDARAACGQETGRPTGSDVPDTW